MVFSLEHFEYLAYSRQQEESALQLKQLLSGLDAQLGRWGEDFSYTLLESVRPEDADIHIATRLAGAISALFSDPSFYLSPNGFSQLIVWQRWLSVIFATSAYRNADHVIRSLNINGNDLSSLVLGDERTVVKFCLLYTAESEIVLDIDALWNYNPVLAAALAFALMSTRFTGSPASHGKRETLLGWLPARLEGIADVDLLPTSILHDVYMHCSYADLPQKHDIKRAINVLIRRKLAESGLEDLPVPLPAVSREKPVILLLLEWFTAAHSVYRVLSVALRALRLHFRLVAAGFESMVDDVGKAVFDEFVPLPQEELRLQLQQLRALAQQHAPEIFFIPSLGMTLATIYASNMRLAPLQMFAFGHPATSHSAGMDYFIIEQDFLGKASCFSEKLLCLPPASLPFVPSSRLPGRLNAVIRRHPGQVRIVVPGSLMKLNPGFLAACQSIARRTETPVQFHFLVGLTDGLVWAQVRQVIGGVLGDAAVVYPHLDYAQYMEVIGKCDMFLSPFPFGNGNGVVDVLTLCLAGVCRTGDEVCEHVDHGLFLRAGLPEWLIAGSTEAFVAAAVRLVDNHEERARIRDRLAADNAVKRLFLGRAETLGEHLVQLLAEKRARATS